MATLREDPYPAHNFLVQIDDILEVDDRANGGFSEVSGINIETPIAEYRSGGDFETRLIPLGGSEVVTVTLKRGVTGSVSIFEWFDQARRGDPQVKKTVSIILLNEEREPVVRWQLAGCVPSRLRTPDLNAQAGMLAIEELELKASRIELVR